MSRTYGKTEWREDLKTLLRKSSTPELHMVFLFIESQVLQILLKVIGYNDHLLKTLLTIKRTIMWHN